MTAFYKLSEKLCKRKTGLNKEICKEHIKNLIKLP
jgi:hypothetical protein